MHDHHIPGFVQQFLLDEVHMGNLPCLLFQIGVVLNINAAVGDHGGHGLGGVRIAPGHRDGNIGPFHFCHSLLLSFDYYTRFCYTWQIERSFPWNCVFWTVTPRWACIHSR